MTADIVIRGGTVVDGTGAPAPAADVAITDGVVSDIGDGLDGKRVLDAGGHVVTPGLRRHPHPLRRPGVLGPRAHAVVLARRDDRRRRQLRLLDRAGPARAPRAARPHAPARRGHGARHAVRRRAVGRLRDLPAVLRRDRAARHAAQLRVLRRPHRGAPLRDGRSRATSATPPTTRSRHAARDRRGAGRGRGRVRDLVVADAQRRPRPAGAVPHRRPRRAARAARAAARREQGRRRARCPARRSRTPTCTTSSAASAARSRGPRCSRSRASRGTRRSWRRTPRRAPTASQVWPQVSCRPLAFQMNLREPFTFNMRARVPGADGPAARRAHGRVPRSRRGARGRGTSCRAAAAALPIELRLACASPRAPRTPSSSAARSSTSPRSRACTPFDVMLDLSLEENLETRFSSVLANNDPEAIAWLLPQDTVLLGLADSGAHVSQLCDACFATDLLGNWVRDKEVMPLEHAIHKLTRRAGRRVRPARPRDDRSRQGGRRRRVRLRHRRARSAAPHPRLPRRRRAPRRRPAGRACATCS